MASWLIPGAAGLLGDRPFLGLAASLAFAGAASVWFHRVGVAPDPLAVGSLPWMLAAILGSALLAIYFVFTALAVALRERN